VNVVPCSVHVLETVLFASIAADILPSGDITVQLLSAKADTAENAERIETDSIVFIMTCSIIVFLS